MTEKKLIELVENLSKTIISAPDKLSPSERNEEWTKMVLILPLLEGLGWDRATDISYESSPDDVDGWLDFFIRSHPPIGIEAKALDVMSPSDINHPQVKKGLKQSKDRGADFFIWTNGDCWQFYSHELEQAPLYQVILSKLGDGSEYSESIVKKLRVVQKQPFDGNPDIFNEAIRSYWKISALPEAWNSLIENDLRDLQELIRKRLPENLDIEEDEILNFLKGLRPKEGLTELPRPRKKSAKKSRSFPDDWENLIKSYEPDFDRARKRFRKGYYRKFAQFLTGNSYEPWSRSTTWRHVGAPNETSERKKLGPVISLFISWCFIEKSDVADRYQRVEKSVPYLEKLIGT